MLFTDSTNSFGYAILSSKVSVSIATFEIERNMKTKHIETKGTNEASSNSHLSWNWNWKTINSFCCKQTDKQFPRKKKEMQRNVWLEIVSSLTSEECKRNEIHLNTIEEMGEYCMLLLLSPPSSRILHNLPNDTVTKTNVNYLRVIFLCVCNYKRKNNSLSQLIIVWMPDLK